MATLDDTIVMRRANIFKIDKDNSDVLPVVYGNHNVGGQFGLVQCVEINTDRTFLISDSPIYAVTAVYDANGDEITENYTVYTNGTCLGIPNIAFIDFKIKGGTDVDFPYAKPISVNCIGKVDSNGRVIENPLDVAIDFMKTRGVFTDADFDLGSVRGTIAKLEAMRFKVKWLFDADIKARDCLLNLCFNFLGNVYLQNRKIYVNITPPIDKCGLSYVDAHIISSRDCPGGDSNPTYSVDISNITSKIVAEFNFDFKNGKFLNYSEFVDQVAIRTYATPEPIKIQFKGIISEGLARQLCEFLLRQYSREKGWYVFEVKRMKCSNIRTGSLIGFTWRGGIGPNGVKNEILKVIEIGTGISDQTNTVKAMETYNYISNGPIADGSVKADGSRKAGLVRSTTVYP